jgi:hypothetical protein
MHKRLVQEKSQLPSLPGELLLTKFSREIAKERPTNGRAVASKQPIAEHVN